MQTVFTHPGTKGATWDLSDSWGSESFEHACRSLAPSGSRSLAHRNERGQDRAVHSSPLACVSEASLPGSGPSFSCPLLPPAVGVSEPPVIFIPSFPSNLRETVPRLQHRPRPLGQARESDQ